MCRSSAEGGRRCPGRNRSGGDSASAGYTGDASPALADLKAEMRKWRSSPAPEPGPAEPMSSAKAKLLGCDTPEGRAKYDRLRAYREAGYGGPLDRNNNIPDPDDPAEQRTLDTLAALSLTHS